MKRWTVYLTILAVLAILALPALAGPRTTASGTLSMGGSQVRAAVPSRGSAVSLDAAYAGIRKQDKVRVQLICMQDGSVVYGDATPLSGSPQTLSFTLGQSSSTATSVWESGGASCRADLFYIASAGGGTVTFLAALTFNAEG